MGGSERLHQKLEAAVLAAEAWIVEKGTGGGKPLPYARKERILM
jgi:hypothetical protein